MGGQGVDRHVSGLPDPSYHHASHRHLLTDIPAGAASPRKLDAVIVPASRPVSWLREPMHLVRDLDCTMVVLCSKSLAASEVIRLAEAVGVGVLAVDLNSGGDVLPQFATNELLVGTEFERNSDTSGKRNLALLLAHIVGWQRVLFLDDDITDVQDAEAAAGLLDAVSFTAVGLRNDGYPDNSIVCHIHRSCGASQDQFIGAGALVVAPTRTRSFFPNTYNQDWLFLIGDHQPPRLAVTGSMRQLAFDPFEDPDRARREELGDCLAEGLYWLLDNEGSIGLADTSHWRDFLTRRARFIDRLIHQVTRQDSLDGDRARWTACLEVARRTCSHVTPQLCADYISAWRKDLEVWRRFVAEAPTGLDVDKALRWLGLADQAQRT
jgi:hypothetical protein